MYRISVFFKDGEWASKKSKYSFFKLEELNGNQDAFVSIEGIIARPKDIDKILIEEIEEKVVAANGNADKDAE